MSNYSKINSDLLKLLKKHDVLGYVACKHDLQNNTNPFQNVRIQSRLYSLFLSSLKKEDAKSILLIDKEIRKLAKNLEFELLGSLSETNIIDLPRQATKQALQYSNVIALRDKQGFFPINNKYDAIINKYNDELILINNLINNKERIMISNLPVENKKLSKKEAELLSYSLGYGKLREEILNNNSREKHKVEESSKGYK